MDYIEIKYDKVKLLFIVITAIFAIIGGIYMLYFTKTFDDHLVLKIIVSALVLLFIYAGYTQFKSLFANHPVITITKSYIEINKDGNPQTFSWTEIKELTIEKRGQQKQITFYLIIKLETITEEVNISDLDKNVNDIREFITILKPKNSTVTDKMDKEWLNSK